jgi:ABC-2 type transport system permease protein
MSTTTVTAGPAPGALPRRAPRRTTALGALLTLARRRAALTSRTPRQIAVPLVGPALLALVVAPALQVATGGLHGSIDYTSFVGVGAVGLVVPLSCVFAGISVLVDRESGAQRELLAAPVSRTHVVLGNLVVALGLATMQVAVLIGLTAARGGDFAITLAGAGWFVGGAVLFTVFMYGVTEALAARVHQQEEYIAAIPGIAILPFFFAGALFPIDAMPTALTAIAKVFPLTHALALMRYGIVDHHGGGLHDIWGSGSTTTEAWLSVAVVAAFAVAMTALAIRTFARSAVR